MLPVELWFLRSNPRGIDQIRPILFSSERRRAYLHSADQINAAAPQAVCNRIIRAAIDALFKKGGWYWYVEMDKAAHKICSTNTSTSTYFSKLVVAQCTKCKTVYVLWHYFNFRLSIVKKQQFKIDFSHWQSFFLNCHLPKNTASTTPSSN